MPTREAHRRNSGARPQSVLIIRRRFDGGDKCRLVRCKTDVGQSGYAFFTLDFLFLSSVRAASLGFDRNSQWIMKNVALGKVSKEGGTKPL